MDKVNVTGLKALRNEMITFVKGEVDRKRAGHVGIAADDCDDHGDDPPSASQAVGVAHTVDDARGTPQGEPGADVDRMDEGAGRAEKEEEEVEEEEEEDDDDEEEEDEEEAAIVGEAEKQQEGEEEELVELEIIEGVVECDDGAEKLGGRTADVVNGGVDEADDACVGAAPGRGEKVVVGDVAGVIKEVVDPEAGVGGDTAAATTRTGMDGPTEAKAVGERSRKNKAARGHPGPAASGRRAPVDVVELLRAENTRLRADNARLQESLNDQTGRVDILAKAVAGLLNKLTALTAQVAATEQKASKRIEDATSAMSTTLADEITDNIADAIDATKVVSRFVVDWLKEMSGPQRTIAVERASAVTCVVEHQNAVWKGLEETIISYIGAAQTNIAAAVSRPIVLPTPPPPPPAPTQAIPEEFLQSFKADVLKAVTEVT
ncbi:unnamed protein product [Closterium sp. NIES-65]|nr:unnamed protein product [Closterium sp. NIES-65]